MVLTFRLGEKPCRMAKTRLLAPSFLVRQPSEWCCQAFPVDHPRRKQSWPGFRNALLRCSSNTQTVGQDGPRSTQHTWRSGIVEACCRQRKAEEVRTSRLSLCSFHHEIRSHDTSTLLDRRRRSRNLRKHSTIRLHATTSQAQTTT